MSFKEKAKNFSSLLTSSSSFRQFSFSAMIVCGLFHIWAFVFFIPDGTYQRSGGECQRNKQKNLLQVCEPSTSPSLSLSAASLAALQSPAYNLPSSYAVFYSTLLSLTTLAKCKNTPFKLP